jgi:chromosome segregation ATPase
MLNSKDNPNIMNVEEKVYEELQRLGDVLKGLEGIGLRHTSLEKELAFLADNQSKINEKIQELYDYRIQIQRFEDQIMIIQKNLGDEKQPDDNNKKISELDFLTHKLRVELNKIQQDLAMEKYNIDQIGKLLNNNDLGLQSIKAEVQQLDNKYLSLKYGNGLLDSRIIGLENQLKDILSVNYSLGGDEARKRDFNGNENDTVVRKGDESKYHRLNFLIFSILMLLIILLYAKVYFRFDVLNGLYSFLRDLY